MWLMNGPYVYKMKEFVWILKYYTHDLAVKFSNVLSCRKNSWISVFSFIVASCSTSTDNNVSIVSKAFMYNDASLAKIKMIH